MLGEEEGVEVSGCGRKAFLEQHTFSLHSWLGKLCNYFKCFIVQVQAHLAFPRSRSPIVSWTNKWISVRTGSSYIYWTCHWSIHKSGTWTRSLVVVNGRHTASFLWPETTWILQIALEVDIFLTQDSVVWMLQINNKDWTPNSTDIGVHI